MALVLDQQIESARKEIAPDGYDMSVGEILNLYRDNELIIHPAYQRLFRWNDIQKTRFIESLLLGIPVPPIFVFQTSRGAWELIDGLQRLSTIFEFVGVLKRRKGEPDPPGPVALLGTNFLPDLEGKTWQSPEGDEERGIGPTAQLSIKRARIRVEILKKESDPIAKYELFQRLNTGGTELSEQEVRNCTALMINPDFYNWLRDRSLFEPFVITTAQTDEALKKQAGVELALRFVAFRQCPYEQGLDVHEYLDKSLITLASDKKFAAEAERRVFERTFHLLNDALGNDSFKRWEGERFTGKFLMSVFEVISIGVSKNVDQIESLGGEALNFIVNHAKELWQNDVFQQNSGAGVRRNHTTREALANGGKILSRGMKIRTLGQLQTALDEEIAWRVKEIADIRLAAKRNDGLSERTLIRAGTAILYAHWEGFVKSAATAYINFVDNQGKTYGDLQTCFAVLGIKKQLTELVLAKKSRVRIAAVDFIRQSSETRSQLQKFTVDTESNLNAEVFENIALSIGIKTQPYESRFKLMDESLLRRRNKIAHGEYLTLDVDAWRDLAEEVISLMRDFKTDIENAASTSAFAR